MVDRIRSTTINYDNLLESVEMSTKPVASTQAAVELRDFMEFLVGTKRTELIRHDRTMTKTIPGAPMVIRIDGVFSLS